MRALFTAGALITALSATAQQKPKPGLNAEQIIEKSIEASGGRAAMSKLTSTQASGLIEFVAAQMHGKMEIYAKAPNKQLVRSTFEGVGDVRQGFDGQVAWSQDPAGGVQELSGAALDEIKRAAVFNASLKWRELYPKIELIGEETIGEHKAYAVRLTPATGKPSTRYFDADTFLLIREVGSREVPVQGNIEIRADFSDYRDVGGLKEPFQIRQVMPMGEVVIQLTEVKHNVPIDDAMFSKPTK